MADMKPSNDISIKGTIYVNDRKKEVDGPWKPTLDEAILAFADMLTLKGWRKSIVFRPFVARKEHRSIAACCDSKGNYYSEVATPDLNKWLSAAHVCLEEDLLLVFKPLEEEDKDDWDDIDVTTAEGYAMPIQTAILEVRRNRQASPDAVTFSFNLRQAFQENMVKA